MLNRASVAVLCLVFALAFRGIGDAWRKANDRGNRYEGKASVQVAASPFAELIGFHAYRQDFAPSGNAELQVRFYAAAAPPAVRITAREYDPRELYWMEAKPRAWTRGWNRFAPWPVTGVLSALRIPSGNLIVLVRLDRFSTGGGAVAPAFITTSGAAAETREYHAYFLPGKDLDSAQYELRRNATVVSSGSFEKLPGEIPFTIRLPVAGAAAGPMQLVLKCRVARETGPPATLVYTFDHQPRAPAVR